MTGRQLQEADVRQRPGLATGLTLTDISDEIERLYERHQAATRSTDWSYLDYLPLDAYAAGRDRRPLSPTAYLAVETALLTEANLPWYTTLLCEYLGNSAPALHEFVKSWTAEEDQHGLLLETYLLLTANGDHRERAQLRKETVASGWRVELCNPLEVVTFTAIQEMQTRVFYINAARECEADDTDLAHALRRISRDETLHLSFYRDVVRRQLEVDPDLLPSVARVIFEFRMPSFAIADYPARQAALSGSVFGPDHYLRDVLSELYEHWQIESLPLRSPDAIRAREDLRAHLRVLARLSSRFSRRRTAAEPAR